MSKEKDVYVFKQNIRKILAKRLNVRKDRCEREGKDWR